MVQSEFELGPFGLQYFQIVDDNYHFPIETLISHSGSHIIISQMIGIILLISINTLYVANALSSHLFLFFFFFLLRQAACNILLYLILFVQNISRVVLRPTEKMIHRWRIIWQKSFLKLLSLKTQELPKSKFSSLVVLRGTSLIAFLLGSNRIIKCQ